MRCKGRYVSDTLYIGRFPFLTDKDIVRKLYYHLPLYCANEPLYNEELCQDCICKKDKLKTADIKNNRLINIRHPQVLHGTIDDPIPDWSHIKEGLWFKNQLLKGLKIETMVKKVILDEKKVFADLESLHGDKEILNKMALKYPKLSKTDISRYVINYNKKHKMILEQPTYLVSNEAIDAEEEIICVEVLKLSAIEYYYDRINNKLYTLDYDYVGKYNNETETIDACSDSD